MHALRRNAVTGLCWSFFHLPLHMALVAAGAGLAVLIKHVGISASLQNAVGKAALMHYSASSAALYYDSESYEGIFFEVTIHTY
jgi:hypothetical protein